MNKCPTSGKRGYPSEKSAKKATAKAGNRIRVYLCPDCHRFHVTSKAFVR